MGCSWAAHGLPQSMALMARRIDGASHRWRVLRLPRRVLAPAGRSWGTQPARFEAQNPTLINRRAPDLAVRLPR